MTPAPPASDAVEASVFAAPWEAQVFAMAVGLQDAGVVTAAEWAEALGRAIRTAAAEADGPYAAWIAALEALVAEKGIAAREALSARRAAFDRAARATPHGAPILLENDPLGPDG